VLDTTFVLIEGHPPIDSTKKSEQNLNKSLKDIKSLEDAEKEHGH
jgi:hypothetical protein